MVAEWPTSFSLSHLVAMFRFDAHRIKVILIFIIAYWIRSTFTVWVTDLFNWKYVINDGKTDIEYPKLA